MHTAFISRRRPLALRMYACSASWLSRLCVTFLLLFSGFSVHSAVAQQYYNVTLSGTVQYFYNPSGTSPFDGSVVVGTPYTASYLFTPSGKVNGSLSSDPTEAEYGFSSNVEGFTVKIGNYTFTPSIGSTDGIQVDDNHVSTGMGPQPPFDGFFFHTNDLAYANTSPSSPAVYNAGAYFGLVSYDTTTLSSVSIPTAASAYNLSKYTDQHLYNGFQISGYGAPGYINYGMINASIAQISITSAPEPSQSAALGLGVLGLGSLVLRARRLKLTA